MMTEIEIFKIMDKAYTETYNHLMKITKEIKNEMGIGRRIQETGKTSSGFGEERQAA